MSAVDEMAPAVGTVSACHALQVPRATYYRRKQVAQGVGPARRDRRPSPRRLTEPERKNLLTTLHSDRFVDKAPAEVYATLLDEGVFLCSERTMYRVLAEANEVRERRDQLRHPSYSKPELLATGPNQVWSWDITKLLGPAKWTYFYLYVILDIFSRYVVGWMVAHRESAELARRLIMATCEKQGIEPDQLTLHSDRGSAMKAKVVAQMLADLGVTKSHSRPSVSDDNPYSESQFKTLKYRPEFPDRFGSQLDARSHCVSFFQWYNAEHRHSGIGLLTPEMVHYGRAAEVVQARSAVLANAYARHPERFVRGLPTPPPAPTVAWINPPTTAPNAGRPPQPEAEVEPSPKMATPPEVHQPHTASRRSAGISREVALQ